MDQIAFPVFDANQLEVVAKVGVLKEFAKDAVLIRQGEKGFPFFVIKSGSVRIVESQDGIERLVTNHDAGQFTGDVDMLTGRMSVISAIANEDVQVYELTAGRLRTLLNECPNVSETLLDAFQHRRKLFQDAGFVGVRLIGENGSAATSRIQELFYKNHVPHSFFNAESDLGKSELAKLGAEGQSFPIVHCNGNTLSNPSLISLSKCIGIATDIPDKVFDLVVIGSGPAGLAAAVYAASEGIQTLVVDSVGPGGQAGSSSKIENFIGFPTGLSGSDLANRGYLQALKFGATFVAPITVKVINQDVSGEHHLILDNGETIKTKCVLVASGVTYRQLQIPGFSELEGAGVYYAATSVESRVCEKSTAVVIGGGNSAGQAAMFLAKTANSVKILIRGGDLQSRMSSYLSERVVNHPKIELLKYTEVKSIIGEGRVQSVEVINNQTGEQFQIPLRGLVYLYRSQTSYRLAAGRRFA